MPFYTEKFKLPFFSRGEIYSAARDRQRFESIDSELSHISNLIGSGVVSGMNVGRQSEDQIYVDEGIFCVEGRVYINAIKQKAYIDSLGVNYVWASPSGYSNIAFGNQSNVVEISYLDSSAGMPVTDVEFETVSPYAVIINIGENIPKDTKRIKIYRGEIADTASSLHIDSLMYPSLSYKDEGVIPGKIYYYYFVNEDVNGFVSETSDVFAYSSPQDLSVPDFPSNMKAYPAHRSICITWENSLSKNISHYIVSCAQNGVVEEKEVLYPFTNVVFTNLKNGSSASISIRSITFAGIESEPFSITSAPLFHPGARDSDSISAYFEPSSSDGVTKSVIRLTWENPFIDPNLNDLSLGEQKELSGLYDIITKYQVWEIRNNGLLTIQGEPEIAYVANEIVFSFFKKKNSNNQIVNENIKDNSLYLIKLNRVVDGLESIGRYVYVKTGDVTPPAAPKNIMAELQNDGSIDVTWSLDNISEIKKQKIKVESAPILSTNYDYSAKTFIGFKFSAIKDYILNGAIFEDKPPFRIGYVDGYFVFEPEESRIEAIANIGSISGFGNIVGLEILSPPGGIYLAASGLSMDEIKSNFFSIPPVLKFTSNAGSIPKAIDISLADMFEIMNMSGKPDGEVYFNNTVRMKPTPFSFDNSYFNAPNSVNFYVLNDGFSFDDIVKTVSIGEYSLDFSDELLQNTFYKINSNFTLPDRRYKISLYSFDLSNNISESSYVLYDTDPLWSIAPPQAPSVQIASIEDGIVKVSWIPSYSDDINGYEVIRSEINDGGLTSTISESRLRWEKIAELSTSINEYYDYLAEPGKFYVYRVVSVGLLGKKSPIFFALNENNETTNIRQALQIDEGSYVPSISVSVLGNDAVINFNNGSGEYGGFHLYKSFNYGPFIKIASIAMGDASFIDGGALILSGNYRYIVRPVANKSSIIVTSDENYSDGILLAEVVSSIGNMEITEKFNSLFLASGSVSPELDVRLSNHRHLMIDDSSDSRVNLSSEYEFTNFETDNNQRFLINEELPDLPESYVTRILLNGELTGINYEFVPNRQLIKFSSRLAPLSGQQQTFEPFKELPSIKLIIDIGGETVNNLNKDRLSSVFAQQLVFGKVGESFIPKVGHSGSYGEDLLAKDCIAESVDGFKHILTLNEKRNYLVLNKSNNQISEISEFEYNDLDLSDGIVGKVGFPLNKTRHYMIHDAFNIGGTENFIFATNRGVYYYWQNGSVFNMDLLISSEPPQDSGPCHKIIYCPISRILICLNFRSFDILKISQNGGVALIYAQQGLDFNARVFRDAIETADGSIFLSSDIGLFRIQFGSFVNYQDDFRSSSGEVSNLKIEQLSLLSGTSTDTYALWTDEDKNTLYVSTEYGTFYSSNYGQLFSIDQSLSGVPALWNAFLYQNVLFAISENSIYRKREDEEKFVRIFYDENFIFRKFFIKYGRLIFPTNDGLYCSESISSCKYNPSVFIKPINIELSESNSRKHVYSVCNFGSYLLACLEGKTKIMYSIDRYAEHVDFSNSIVIHGTDDFPTVFIDGRRVESGVYFQYSYDGQRDDCIFFDKFVSSDKKVTVVRQYSSFYLPSGGWARRDFAAQVNLYKNNVKINEGSRADKPFNQIAYYSELEHSLSDQVSNISKLDNRLDDLKSHSFNMLINRTDTDGAILEYGIHKFTRNNFRFLIDKIDEVNSSIYDDDDAASLGILSSLRIPYPRLDVYFIANSLPGEYGVSKESLNRIGISYENYQEPNFEGSLGTYDPEDPTYYIPNVASRPILEGVSAPNYEFEDSEAFSEDITVVYSGYYGENTSSAALGSVGGVNAAGSSSSDNQADNTVDQGPPGAGFGMGPPGF